MKLLTKDLERRLVQNFMLNQNGEHDFRPVAKFFGGTLATWLVTEYDPETQMFFGLCDLGLGEPELGYVSRAELESIRFPPFGLPVERDRWWEAKMTLSEYAADAQQNRRLFA